MPIKSLRTLPPVGHGIALRTLQRAWRGGNVQLELSRFQNAHTSVFTSSGTAALVVALDACRRVSPRRKVVIPAYTCPSVLAAVGQAGLKAALCDLAPGKLRMDENKLSLLLDGDTLAVVDVHLFGLYSRGISFAGLARKAGAWLIEDAAQAFCDQGKGRFSDCDCDLKILSFGRGKPLSALHGGAVIVNQADLVEPVRESFGDLSSPLPAWFGLYYRMLITAYSFLFDPKWFGLPQALPWFRIGETVYIDRAPVHDMALPARRVLKDLLSKHTAIQENRARAAAMYLRQLEDVRSIFEFLPTDDEIIAGPLRFPIVLKSEDHKAECLNKLSRRRLGVTKSYPVPLNRQAGVPDYVAAQGPFAGAERIAQGILTLPTHEFVKVQDVALIAGILKLYRGF